jgi:outer membrane protein assembly factor BamB
MISRYALCIIGLVFSATLDTASAQQGSVNVVTYHYDTLRTGWNPNETILTTSNVNSSTFGVLAQVTVDDQVDAQPLIVNNTVYVVTENNTVYAIDGGTGAISIATISARPFSRARSLDNVKRTGPNSGSNRRLSLMLQPELCTL